MKEIWRNLKNWQRLGILFGFLAIIIIVVVSVILMINSEPKVEISFSEKNNIPSGELRKARAKLVSVIKANTENFDANTVYKGNARDYKEITSGDFEIAEFIVDFDDIKESYKVSVTWPDPNDGSPNIYIFCPLLDSKFLETPCATEANSSKEIVNFLPYSGKMDNGKEYKIVNKYDNGQMYLEVTTNGDVAQAVAAARKWVSSIYLDPNKYLFYAPSGQYVQANYSDTDDSNVNKNLPYFMPGVYKVYPVVDKSNNVASIKAEIAGCTEYQTNSAQEGIETYLKSKNINYPVNFEYCTE